MKTKTKLALILALGTALTGAFVHAQTEPAEPAPEQTPRPAPGGPPPLGKVLKDLLNKYDVNHDGQLDQTEMAALQKDIDEGKVQPPGRHFGRGPGAPPPLPQDILDKYDTNHDGSLDENERAALHKDIEDGKIQLPQGMRGPGHPGPGGMRPPLTAQAVLQRFDTDKDGKLDEAELTAFLNDLKQHLPPPPRHRGPNALPAPGEPPPGDAPPQQ